MIKVSIVEDNAVMRSTLRKIVQEDDELVLVSEHESCEEAEIGLIKYNPDIVLMDINLFGKNSIEVIKKIKAQKQMIQFLMCTVYDDNDNIFESLKAGATGYILKRSSAKEITNSIKSLYQGGSPMSSEIARKVVTSFFNGGQSPSQMISERENEILSCISKGFTYKECADKLFISPATVRNHLHKIYEKLEVKNKTEAANKYLNN
jgi:DNA-binding NarL/FixJ family response regulator